MSLIIAVDDSKAFKRVAGRIGDLCGIASGFKLGIPLLLSAGLDGIRRVKSRCSGLWIADLKLADIGAIMVKTVDTVADAFDAIIAHSFIGAKGALWDLKEYMDSRGLKMILVASMSHPGSREIYDAALDRIMGVVERVKPWGIVAPATRPSIIEKIRSRMQGSIKILAPGIGPQGAEPGDAICAGADYEIVGRMITSSSDIVEAARSVVRAMEERVCG